MNPLGSYEVAVLSVLRRVRIGPWDVLDLIDVEHAISQGVKESGSVACDAHAVRDWLRSLAAEDRGDLIDRLNEVESAHRIQAADLAPASG